MTKIDENSFTYEFAASDDFTFKFYVSDDNGLLLSSYDTNYQTVSNYDGTKTYWCSNSGNTDITFKVDQRYTKYRIDLTFGNTGGDGNKYFKFTVTGVTEGGSSDPESKYILMKGDGTNKEGTQVATFTGTNFPYTATYNITVAGEYYFYVNDGAKNYFNTNQKINTDGGSATIYQYNENFFDRVVKLIAPRAGEYTFKFDHVEGTRYTLQCNFPSDTEAKYTVTVSSADESMGTVSPASVSVNGTTSEKVTATPKSGYKFVNWTATEGVTVADASAATTTVKATKTGTLTAYFKAKGSTSAPQVEKVKLYVKNAAGWTGDMYAYVFKSSTEHNAAYPGVKMTSVTGNDYDFEYTVPEGYENGYVIFSAGSNRFPADKRSGFGIRNASHIFNNEHNTWIAPQSSTIEGKNSITIYAYINDDKAWYPTDKGDGNDGDINIGTNFYIFAYTNASKSEYHAYDPDNGDKKLTTNDYNPGYGKTAGTAYNDYGDYCDETVYPVKYGSISTDLRYAKFVIHYDKELEGKTAFYTLNSGSLGTGQTKYGEGYQIRQLFKDGNGNNALQDKKGTPYYYELPSVKLENGTSYSFRLGYAGYEHKDKDNEFIAFLNYKIEDATSDVAKVIFPTVKLDDDYNCKKGIDDNSKGPFFSEKETTNIWEEAKTYNVNMYRPFYSDGLYETICLPFDVPASEVIKKFGEGTKLFKVTAATETTITFTEQTEANCYIEAGVPYIILPQLSGVDKSNWGAGEDNGTVITFAAKEMKCAYDAVSQQKAISYKDNKGEEQSLKMKGCFIPSLIGKADRFFNTTADNKNVFYQQAYNDRRVIRGTRVFFNDTKDPEVTVSVGGQPVSAKSIILDSEDEPIVTGLYAPETGKIEVLKDTRVFSISGQYVGTSLNGLSKGIYVVNGKKVVIK